MAPDRRSTGSASRSRLARSSGLLGPNGAGKTTTLSVLATLRRPDAGDAEVARHVDAPASPRASAACSAWCRSRWRCTRRSPRARTCAASPACSGSAGGRPRGGAARRSRRSGSPTAPDDVVATFSGGMQRRLNLACALLHRPAVLLLDEPTVGVDPQSRERILDTVRAQAAAGTAVLYSTHLMDEAERLCDRVVLIDGGRVVAAGSPAELTRQAGGGVRLVVVTREPLPDGWLDGCPGRAPGRRVRRSSRRAGTATRSPSTRCALAARVLERAGDVRELHVHGPDLQDVFFRVTGPRPARLMRAFLCTAGEGPATAVARPRRPDVPRRSRRWPSSRSRVSSLANLYGADPTGQTAYELPLADEDGGALGRDIRERLAARDRRYGSGRSTSAAEAERLVRDKQAGTALVIPRGHAGGARRRASGVARALHRRGQVPRAPERAGAPARAARRAGVGACRHARAARRAASATGSRASSSGCAPRSRRAQERLDGGVAGRRARAAARGPRGAGRRSPAS